MSEVNLVALQVLLNAVLVLVDSFYSSCCCFQENPVLDVLVYVYCFGGCTNLSRPVNGWYVELSFAATNDLHH